MAVIEVMELIWSKKLKVLFLEVPKCRIAFSCRKCNASQPPIRCTHDSTRKPTSLARVRSHLFENLKQEAAHRERNVLPPGTLCSSWTRGKA